jgi:uncharacterized protein (TIGR02996 family)
MWDKILEQPLEDTHRLVYADYLEDHEQEAAAIRIRKSMEFEKTLRLTPEIRIEEYKTKLSRLERNSNTLEYHLREKLNEFSTQYLQTCERRFKELELPKDHIPNLRKVISFPGMNLIRRGLIEYLVISAFNPGRAFFQMFMNHPITYVGMIDVEYTYATIEDFPPQVRYFLELRSTEYRYLQSYGIELQKRVSKAYVNWGRVTAGLTPLENIP